MSRKKEQKPYWEMTTEELAEATKEFDEEFVFERTRPLSPKMRARWELAKAKGEPPSNGKTEAQIAIRLDKTLLKKSMALAKKMRLSRDVLIACGLRALLAAQEE